MSRRVVVTGVGLVSSLGIGTEANWDALCAGRTGIARITHFDAGAFATQIAGEVKDFDPLRFVEKKEVKKMDPFIQYAIAASQFAVDDARLEVTPENSFGIGVYIASGIGGFGTIENEHEAYLAGGPRKISPFFIPAAIINLAAGQVSIRFGARGPTWLVHGVFGVGARHRRLVRDHPARRRRRDDRGRRRGGDHADERGRVRRHAGAVHAQRRAGAGEPAVRRAIATASSSGEGAGIVILEELERALARGATDLRRGRRLRLDAVTPIHMTAPARRRRRCRARHEAWPCARAGVDA